MANGAARTIAGIWEIQHYLAFMSDESWGQNLRVTEDTQFDTSNDDSTYEPEYLDRKVQPTYVMGRKTTIEFEVDAVLPGDIQKALYEVEDELNVPVLYTRAVGVDFATGASLPATSLKAKQAEGVLTMNPISGEASGPAKLTGSVKITGDWTYGTFDSSTNVFTADGSEGGGE